MEDSDAASELFLRLCRICMDDAEELAVLEGATQGQTGSAEDTGELPEPSQGETFDPYIVGDACIQ
ncbi:hypothetical protein KIPB_016857, partial [Kipferlia bialata]|eukprot:g16857.t1